MKAKLSFLAALCCTLFSFAQPAPDWWADLHGYVRQHGNMYAFTLIRRVILVRMPCRFPRFKMPALDCFLQYQHGLKDAAPHRIQAGVRYQIGH